MERKHKHLLSWFLWRNSIVPLHIKRKEKKPLKYCRGIRCSAGLLNLQSLKNLMTVVSLASFVD